MTTSIEVDGPTYRALEFAARMADITAGDVVARLVAEASMPDPVPTPEDSTNTHMMDVYVDYAGHRTHGRYDPDTTRIDIVSGPLVGRSFKTPTGAARAIVAHYNPSVSPSRNGWSFWVLDDGTGRFLQSIRSPR